MDHVFVVPIEFLKAPSLDAKQMYDFQATAAETDPTPAQMEAGNYRKGHIEWNGLRISIETTRGGTRKAKDGSWKVENMPAHYGYIKKTEGADGDHVDVYVGSNPESDKVFIIDQLDLKTGAFDEHKCMIGFHHAEGARRAYVGSFSDNAGSARIGGMSEVPVEEFKAWVKSGDCKAPFCMPELQFAASLFEYLLWKKKRQVLGAPVGHVFYGNQRKRNERHGAPVGHEFYGNQYTDGSGGGGESKGGDRADQDEQSAAVTARFEKAFRDDPKGMVKKYLDHPEAKDKYGTTVISADVAKELSEDYSASKENRGLYAGDVHETASSIAKAAYDEVLKQPIAPGRINAIMFTAGGPGVGKSSGQGDDIKNIAETAHAVMDGNMKDANSAIGKIDKALNAGMSVPIVHVYRDPEESYLEGVVPRGARVGRMVSIDSAMMIHKGANEAILEVQEKYKGDPRVTVRFVDNSLGKGNARVVSTVPNKGPRTRADYNAASGRLRSKVEDMFKAGKISRAMYEGAMRRDVSDSS
jgi:hypothetical protein